MSECEDEGGDCVCVGDEVDILNIHHQLLLRKHLESSSKVTLDPHYCQLSATRI